jgi:hypothetical protein
LRFREAGRQRSVYLGRSAALVSIVQRRLQQLRKQSLQLALLRAAVKASFRRKFSVWKQDLAAWGLQLHGLEIRGWRNFRPPIQEALPVFGQQNSISPDSNVGYSGRGKRRTGVYVKKSLLRLASTGAMGGRSAAGGC